MIDKKILYFDTECTGLVNKKSKELSIQPHIIQFCYAIVHANGVNNDVEEVLNRMYKPPIAIPERSTAVHGITDERVQLKGNIAEEIVAIRKKMKEVDHIVAFNAAYDLNCMWAALKRIDEHKGFYNEVIHKVVDPMKIAKKYVGAKDKRGRLKYPRLSEMYEFLFGEEMEGAHDAYYDVEALIECVQELISRKVIIL